MSRVAYLAIVKRDQVSKSRTQFATQAPGAYRISSFL